MATVPDLSGNSPVTIDKGVKSGSYYYTFDNGVTGYTEWIGPYDTITVSVDGTTWGANVEMATLPDKSNAVIVGTQDQDDPAANYDSEKVWWRVQITSNTGGLVVGVIARESDL